MENQFIRLRITKLQQILLKKKKKMLEPTQIVEESDSELTKSFALML